MTGTSSWCIILRGLILVCLGLLFVTAEASAAGTAEEVGQLLTSLERSPCMFNRNGTWFSAAEGRAHLESKYRYLVSRDMIHTAEDFINLAATASSRTGKPYQVQCAGEEPVPSATWMTTELQRLRRASIAPAR